MQEFLITLTTLMKTIAEFAFIPWVWVPLGILTWVGTIYLFGKGSNSWDREDNVMIGAIAGVFLGFISPGILAFSPVIIMVVLAIVAVVFAGVGVAKLLGVDK